MSAVVTGSTVSRFRFGRCGVLTRQFIADSAWSNSIETAVHKTGSLINLIERLFRGARGRFLRADEHCSDLDSGHGNPRAFDPRRGSCVYSRRCDFLIAELDNPFRGQVSIGPESIARVYETVMQPAEPAINRMDRKSEGTETGGAFG
jgi:hypothetical protein